MKTSFLALDVGEARIGIAAGDDKSSFAFGRGYITRQNIDEDIRAIKTKLQEENANVLIVGLPKRTDGKDSAQTQKVRDFALALQEAGCIVMFEDERFTTQVATQNIVKSGKKKKKRQEKGLVDEASAILILETYLSKLKQSSPGNM